MADSVSRSGTRYSAPEVVAYVDELHASHDEALQRAVDAADGDNVPAIQVGRSEGRFLQMLASMMRMTKVVEVGTLAGYSAIRIARGMRAGGTLWSVEYNAEHAAIGRRNIEAAELDVTVHVVEGAGREVLPTLEQHGPFDAVFVDADKGNYDFYGEWAARNLRTGGVLLGDNAYFFGRLLDPDDDAAAAMRRFHEHAQRDLDTVCLPTPDGLLVGIKR